MPHIWAAATSVAVTEALLILIECPHTPAGTTTLLVSLGIFTSVPRVLSLAAGIVLITATSWAINRSLRAPVPVWGPCGS